MEDNNEVDNNNNHQNNHDLDEDFIDEEEDDEAEDHNDYDFDDFDDDDDDDDEDSDDSDGERRVMVARRDLAGNMWYDVPEGLRDDILFESQCKRLEKDDEELTLYNAAAALDDSKALLLGQCMIGNTHLVALKVTIGADLTRRGVHALAGGIRGCTSLEIMLLCADHELSDVVDLRLLYSPSIKQMELHLPVGDSFATRLGAFLSSVYSTVVEGQRLESLAVPLNHMTPHGAQELCRGIQKCDSLGCLAFFFKQPLPSTSFSEVMDILYREGVQKSTSLQTLKLYAQVGNMSTLATVLSNLTHLTLEDMALSVTDAELLSRGLTSPPGAPRFQWLSLHNCSLGDEHMAALAPGLLSVSSTMTDLELNQNQIGDAGIASLVEHWSQNCSLEQLDLSDNKLGPLGGQMLIAAVGRLKKLDFLNLNDNKGIGLDGLQRIGVELSGKNLLDLRLEEVAEWHDYDDDDKCDEAVLQNSKRDLVVKSLLEGVRNNVFLQDLPVSGLNLHPYRLMKMEIYTRANRFGRRLLLQQNTLPAGFWPYFLTQRHLPPSILFIFLRELPTLVMMGNTTTPSAISTSHHDMAGRKRPRDDE